MSRTKEQYESVVQQDAAPSRVAQAPSGNKLVYTALSEFQQKCPIIHHGTKGFGYTYADLPTILQVINPILKECNLVLSQPLQGDKLVTILMHTASGQFIESCIEIPQGVILKGMNDFQVLGSAISYLRRYSIASILNIVTDKDNDAAGEQVKTGPTKKTLNDQEFTRLLGAVVSGKFSAKWAQDNYKLTDVQLAEIQKQSS